MQTRRRFWTLAALIVLAGAVLRTGLAAATPGLSRDGVKFCRQAQALGRELRATLQNPEYEQHPLYPLALLAVQRAAAAGLGAGDSPVAWQNAGLAVSLLAGIAVIVLSGLLAQRLARLAAPELDAARVTLLALLLAAVLPLFVWQSADAMSDELHILWYLAAGCATLSRPSPWSAARCGCWAGLAFLTRPEGAVVGGCAALALLWDRTVGTFRRRVVCAAAIVGLLALCAAPYWLAIGKLSPKSGKQTIEAVEHAATPPPRSGYVLGALVREDVAWFALVPRVVLEVLRAGRVVVPLLALPALWLLGRRMLATRAATIPMCMAAHLTLTVLLLHRHGYLNPRHELVVIALLIPLAAITLHRIGEWAVPRLGRYACGIVVPVVAVLGWYAVRVPNADASPIRETADFLVSHDPQVREKLLLGGSSQSRIAFYANMRFQPWPENRATADAQFSALRDHLRHHQPDYFALDLGSGRETANNGELVQRLEADPEIGPRLVELLRIRRRGAGGGSPETAPVALLFAISWQRPTSQATYGPLP